MSNLTDLIDDHDDSLLWFDSTGVRLRGSKRFFANLCGKAAEQDIENWAKSMHITS